VVKREVRRGRSLFSWTAGSATAVAVSVLVGATGWWTVHPVEDTVSGVPRAAQPTVRSDQEQIRDVLQAMSGAYNRKDVRGTEDNLCTDLRAQWNPQLEIAWLATRVRQGAAEVTITSVDVRGRAAHVTGTQTYANDAKAHDFTAEMGRAAYGWKMCSST
jgi:hypothetical protein